MRKPNDMSKCLAALAQDSTLVAVIEWASKGGWLPALSRASNAIP
jgi:hypothetical protein